MNSVETEKRGQAEAAFRCFQHGSRLIYLAGKRLFDIVFALAAGAVLLLPMLAIGAAVRLDSPGPALFRQARMGKDGNIFIILKFRTMRPEAPDNVPSRELRNPDAYITRVGAFLRRTSLDELPQLWNILRGEMSFVGYRPVCLAERELNSLRRSYGVFEARPGLTGLAQVRGRDMIDYRQKAAMDAEYVRTCGFWLDLWCLVMTLPVILSGEGAA